MFKKILIANRGEIAVRIIRACREMGIKTVAVHSDVDKECLHVKLADESICIGPGPAPESYLNISSIISATEISGADAIHPGYGFLAENEYFADVCRSCKITFIGPSKEAIEKMGNKAMARQIMKDYGVPVIPGTEGCIDPDDAQLNKIAKKIGYPVIVKACAGGGGKGMRVVEKEEDLKQSIQLAQTEAQAAFSDSSIYMEKYIKNPRHIEIQILADVEGHVVSMPERDCSVQRRHQKLIEESPSPFISSSLRKKIGKAARKAARAIDYTTVGTVEFLVDEDGDFYFMEMNTRIQVEHPVTEMVTGIDLVKEQIRLAAGEELDYETDDVEIRGHAIECRINAEDPDANFIPCPGQITNLQWPGSMGVRIDSHIYQGYNIPPFYDSLLAKVIVHADTRDQAIARMERALGEMKVEGVKTIISFHQKVLGDEHFRKGLVDTHFIQKRMNGSGYGSSNGHPNGAKNA